MERPRSRSSSESNSRWIVEVDGRNAEAFEKIMGGDAVCIGFTKGETLVVKGTNIDVPVEELRKAWNDPIWNLMGGVSE